MITDRIDVGNHVSTHSHPKVAAGRRGFLLPFIKCFNTQPPEGGCLDSVNNGLCSFVSTHSHPKVAAYCRTLKQTVFAVSTHSHPKVAAYSA